VESDFDLSHLTPAAQKIAVLCGEERIERIRADRWVGYPLAQYALERLEEVLHWPEKQRMPNILIIGPTNNGKSMIIEKFRRMHSASHTSEAEREIISIVAVQMPSEPSVSRFYSMLLSSVGTPLKPRMRLSELERLTIDIMKSINAQMLIIDELHNVLAGASKAQREFLNLIRFLGNELRIPIVGVGTSEAYLAIRSDDQLENRFQPIILLKWKEGEELKSLMSSFAASLPLRRPSIIGTDDMARYVATRCEGTIGEISNLLNQAAIAAIESGEECINARSLNDAAYLGPSERKRAFERQLVQ
jgi:type II secretory pathway predicted ATPase ExeA